MTLKEVIDGHIVVVDKAFKRDVIKTDTVALALGLKSDDQLFKSLVGKVTHLYALGDCKEPLNIMRAIWDAYEVGRAV